MILTRIVSNTCLVKPRLTVTPILRRYLNAPPPVTNAETQDAFLEPADGRPGVLYLSLNRPKAKNAVSTTFPRRESI